MNERVYTVSEISQEVRRVIERFIAPVWIKGEVSNFAIARSGHVYFSLKDQNAVISCVIWRSNAYSIPFQIVDGMQLMVFGAITTYALQSQYQVSVQKVQTVGLGDLFLAFEALKKKLADEGLFDPARKRLIPPFPRKIGLVTSITGAAVRDFLQISQRRNPAVEIQIFPAQVQGAGAAETIITGIEYFNRTGEVDCIVLARGGGSIEDLWAFNEEKLVRAIAASSLPVVSAVGHEVDYTLADFVADLRAPTPSAAAELVIPDKEQIMQSIYNFQTRLDRIMASQLQSYHDQIKRWQERLFLFRPLNIVYLRRQRLDDLEMRLAKFVGNLMAQYRVRLQGLAQTLTVLDPRSILRRGYAIIYATDTGKMIKTIAMVTPHQMVDVELHDGRLSGKVEKILPKHK